MKNDRSWYCIKTKPHNEILANHSLYQIKGVIPYLPQIRYKRKTKIGLSIVIEPLFSGYIFCKFNLLNNYETVKHAKGVLRLLSYGSNFPVISGKLIEAIKSDLLDLESKLDAKNKIHLGKRVDLVDKKLHGNSGIIIGINNKRERICLLMDFMGRDVKINTTFENIKSDRLF